MKYLSPLVKGRFIKRYKRFLADVEIEGKVVIAHVPNTGSLKTCVENNATCYLTHHSDSKRKLSWTLEYLVIDGHKIGLNTHIANTLVYEAWAEGRLSHWGKFDRIQKEIKVSHQSRLDFVLWSSKDHPLLKSLKPSLFKPPLHFVEIKNVTMATPSSSPLQSSLSSQETNFLSPLKNTTGQQPSKTLKQSFPQKTSKASHIGLFPDSKTLRGTRHIQELIDLMDQGHTCEMIYVIQRESIHSFRIAQEIDPVYYEKLQEGLSRGLQVTPLKVEFKAQETSLTGEVLPFEQ